MNARPSAARDVTEVAVGVLLRPDDAVLLADRPAGKPYAGYWEFPGGKIEPGETVEHALARELHEELGIDIGPALPWVTFEFDYPHAYVRLHFCRIRQWRGTPHGREGQRMSFFRLDGDKPAPLLPAAVPALRWLALPSVAAETAIDRWVPEALLARVDAALAQGLRMLLLRPPAAMADQSAAWFESLGRAIGARAQAYSMRVLVECGLAASGFGSGDGIHLSEGSLLRADSRPNAAWVGADAGSRSAIERAARIGCDFVLSGRVLPDPAVADQGPALGWHGLAPLVRQTPMPVFARGGLSLDDLDRAQHAGAHGLMLPLAAWFDRGLSPR
jgi:8-oxo-dGTP diphosphatase